MRQVIPHRSGLRSRLEIRLGMPLCEETLVGFKFKTEELRIHRDELRYVVFNLEDVVSRTEVVEGDWRGELLTTADKRAYQIKKAPHPYPGFSHPKDEQAIVFMPKGGPVDRAFGVEISGIPGEFLPVLDYGTRRTAYNYEKLDRKPEEAEREMSKLLFPVFAKRWGWREFQEEDLFPAAVVQEIDYKRTEDGWKRDDSRYLVVIGQITKIQSPKHEIKIYGAGQFSKQDYRKEALKGTRPILPYQIDASCGDVHFALEKLRELQIRDHNTSD